MDHRALFKTKIKSIETRKADRKTEQKQIRNNQRADRFTISRNISADENDAVVVNVVSKLQLKQDAFLKKFDDWRVRKQKLKEMELKKKRKPAFTSVVPSGKFLETKFVSQSIVSLKKSEFKPIDWNIVRNNKENAIKKIEVPKLKKILIKAKKENQTKKITEWKTNKKLKEAQPPIFQVPKVTVVKRKKPAPLNISKTENMFNGIGLLTSTNRKPIGGHPVTTDRLDIVNSSLFEGISPIENSQSIINLYIETTEDLSPIEKTDEVIGLNTTYEKIDEIDLNTTPLNTSINMKYLSPFVTTARGKGSVKRERSKRASIYKPNADSADDEETIANHRCKETAQYFKNLLEKEILRLNERCNKWEFFKENDLEISEDSKDLIDVAIGQTRLLINKKFQQFRGLIVQCETLTGDNRVLPEDLEGFWDMIYKQAENLDERYEKLDKLKNNNWEDPDIVTTDLKKKNNGAVKKRGKKTRKDDGLMKLIRMGQKSVQERQRIEKESREKLMDSNRIMTPGHKSLLATVISSEARKTLNQSPILSKTNNVKNVSLMDLNTSTKSILKKERNASRKTVFFNDEITPPSKQTRKVFIATPKEISNLEVAESPKRRSMRTPKPKISFCDANPDTPCSKRKTYAQTPVNKRKYSIAEDTPSSTPRRNSIMTAGGLFVEDDMDTPLSTRRSIRRSRK